MNSSEEHVNDPAGASAAPPSDGRADAAAPPEAAIPAKPERVMSKRALYGVLILAFVFVLMPYLLWQATGLAVRWMTRESPEHLPIPITRANRSMRYRKLRIVC